MMSHRLALASVTALALSVSLFAVAQQPARISITTGGTGGVYYPMGGGMANVLSKNVPGLQATAEVTGGSVDNLKLINAGKAEVGFSMADAAWEATQGVDKFKDNKVNARTLMVLYPNKMHVVSVEGTGINKLSDLKGKRVSTGSPGSGTEIMLALFALMLYPLTLLGSKAFIVAVAVFVLAWIGQFIGHAIEGRKPSFLEDVKFLLVGPAWLLHFIYRRAGIPY